MEAKTEVEDAQKVPVVLRDLIEAWTPLEKVVVSLHKIGSYYATSGRGVPLPVEREQEMLRTLDAFFTPELVHELGKARRLLSQYLPEARAEYLSEHAIDYWRPPDAPTDE